MSNKPRTEFQLEDLAAKWKSYSIQMKQKGRQSLYVTLSKSSPVLKENFLIEFEVANEVQKMELETEKAELLSYLRNELNNFGIGFQIKLTENEDSAVHLTSKDKFLNMAEKNDVLHQLRERLNLDIEY